MALLAPTGAGSSITLQWSSTDGSGVYRGDAGAAGSGVHGVSIYVAQDDASFGLWQSGITATTAIYNGTLGHSYTFYTLAEDNVGLVETGKGVAEARTQLLLPTGTATPTAAPTPTATPTPMPRAHKVMMPLVTR